MVNRWGPTRVDLAQLLRGFLMGGADIIPGVSGGTVALILGIYRRLVTAVSHFDLTLIAHLRRMDFAAALAHVDFRFLLPLGTGILLGIGGLAKLMNHLLENHFAATSSVFFGLILASSFLVARMVHKWNTVTVMGLIAGTIFAYWLVGSLPAWPPEGIWYVLLCGVIGICAMILPGISGSFILLIMGKYGDITAALRDVIEMKASAAQLLMLGVFAVGCLLGLISFSKILRWLLSRWEAVTMAVLCGFLIGSLRKIWPFKRDVTDQYADVLGVSVEKLTASKRIYENLWPDQFNSEVALYLGLIGGAAAFVFALDYLAGGREIDPGDGDSAAGERGRSTGDEPSV